jgi:hypothetical protein
MHRGIQPGKRPLLIVAKTRPESGFALVVPKPSDALTHFHADDKARMNRLAPCAQNRWFRQPWQTVSTD